MTIKNKQSELLKFVLFDKSGNRYVYEIKKFKKDIKVSDAFFNFSPKDHPGVSEVDLR